ncbi:MAG: MBL fold metallo-hydrolase [Elusimicrobia bacterium]|nr:MBL fold metallo-hydrolase [Elusimicrobiota bacterium]
MKIETIPVGSLETNCYIVYDDDSRQAAVIDPGEEPEKILSVIDSLKVMVKLIIHTHGHFDHTGASEALRRKTKAKLLIHHGDVDLAGFTPEAFLHDGEIVFFGPLEFKALHTPGHTPGGITLVGKGFAFTGDTLFNNGVGRTDFTGGNETVLWQSIRGKLFTLPPDTVIYPGHGPASTIGQEKTRWKN